MNGLSFFWRSPLKYIALCGVLMGTVLLGGCAQAPQPVPEPPLQYEDPAVPPPPVAYTDKIREAAVVETTGSRGGAALRAQEDLDVLALLVCQRRTMGKRTRKTSRSMQEKTSRFTRSSLNLERILVDDKSPENRGFLVMVSPSMRQALVDLLRQNICNKEVANHLVPPHNPG